MTIVIPDTQATRMEHDALTAKAHDAAYDARDQLTRAWDNVHGASGERRQYGWGRGQRNGYWLRTNAEALAKLEERLAAADYPLYELAGARRALDGYHATEQTLKDALIVCAELERSYTGWSRAFLVCNGNGHVHSSMNCSTCNRGTYMTRFAWVTDLSDHTEAEIVSASGWRACTVCYPTAPVGTKTELPSTIEKDGALS